MLQDPSASISINQLNIGPYEEQSHEEGVLDTLGALQLLGFLIIEVNHKLH